MNQKGWARLLATIVGVIIGAVIGYTVGQSGWGALVGAGIGAGLLALLPLQFWMGLARIGQIVVLLPWVSAENAVKIKEEGEKKKSQSRHSSILDSDVKNRTEQQ